MARGELGEALELAAEELGSPSQLTQRDSGGVAGGRRRGGAQRRQFADQVGRGVPGGVASQIMGPGRGRSLGPSVRITLRAPPPAYT